MKTADLVLHRIAREEDGVWAALCLDLDLAAQGETLPEAKEKLEQMIEDYIFDALAGDDRQHAGQLLSRKAPLVEWARYYWTVFFNKLWHAKDDMKLKPFTETLPLRPCHQK